MPSGTHINVTVDFCKWGEGQYDLRIPVHQPIKQLLANLIETLDLDVAKASLFALKVPAKQLLLTDDDRLIDYPVTNGDILLVL
ncbi:EsaB/YukD family protein [Neobacillus soli]|uniref:EsaB/YukD family protein n=1 Tax=Neobacillus soli TaxID=220688 RepID=UPI0008245311|nr:EsaB/YukD family protein [Neobacillus soli]